MGVTDDQVIVLRTLTELGAAVSRWRPTRHEHPRGSSFGLALDADDEVVGQQLHQAVTEELAVDPVREAL